VNGRAAIDARGERSRIPVVGRLVCARGHYVRIFITCSKVLRL
jgi:hypothetical protein